MHHVYADEIKIQAIQAEGRWNLASTVARGSEEAIMPEEHNVALDSDPSPLSIDVVDAKSRQEVCRMHPIDGGFDRFIPKATIDPMACVRDVQRRFRREFGWLPYPQQCKLPTLCKDQILNK
jgi:hypothetical protein